LISSSPAEIESVRSAIEAEFKVRCIYNGADMSKPAQIAAMVDDVETAFGAHGKGLHEKISSVQNRLPPALVKRMRFLATIRNRLVHERGFTEIPDRAGFLEAFDAAVVELNALLGTAQNGGSARKACAIA
jgi:NAD(P)-dependent dehydrogenase (short-subunit alcohol dehydrogenase family)